MAPGPRPQPASGAPTDDAAQRRRASLRPAVQQALDALRTLTTRGAQPGDVERAAAALAASDLVPLLAPVLDLPADAPPALRAAALKSRLLTAVEVFRRSRPSGVPLPPAPDGAPPEETLYRFLTRWYVEGDPRTQRARRRSTSSVSSWRLRDALTAASTGRRSASRTPSAMKSRTETGT